MKNSKERSLFCVVFLWIPKKSEWHIENAEDEVDGVCLIYVCRVCQNSHCQTVSFNISGSRKETAVRIINRLVVPLFVLF